MRRMHAGQAVSAALALTLAPAATLGQEEMAPPAQEEQQQQPAETPWAQPQQQQPQQDAQAQLEGRTNLVKASKFTDLEVRDSQGQVVGTLQEVAFDVDHGQVAYGVIALSEGNELRLAPCKAFQLDPSGEFATLSISQDQLQQMQAFDDANWQQLSDPQFAQQIHQQFGLQPYWEKQAQPGQMMPLGQAGQMEQFGQQAQQPQEQQQQQEGAYGTTPPSDQTQQQPGMMSQQRIEQSLQRRFQQAGLAEDQAQQEAQQLAQEIQQQQMQQDQIRQRIEQSLTQAGVDQTTAQQYAQVAAQEVQQLQQQAGAQQPGAQQQPGMAMQQPGQVEKLSVLMERQVRDAQGEELAQVSDFIIDTREGRAAYAVLSYGGFAGIGEKLVAVPYNALQPQPQEEAFTLNATRETLDQLAFESDSWPDMTDQQWASRVHQAFNQPPYWEVYGYGAYITTTPGAGAGQQIEQTLTQGFTQAGLPQEQAQQQAQQLAQELQQQPQMSQEQIQQRIEQSLTQAGVDQATAQQHAQQLASQVQQQLQQQSQQQPQMPQEQYQQPQQEQQQEGGMSW